MRRAKRRWYDQDEIDHPVDELTRIIYVELRERTRLGKMKYALEQPA